MMWKIVISLQQYDLSPQNLVCWCRMCPSSASSFKKFNYKNLRWQIFFRDPFCIIMRYYNFSIVKMAAWNFEIEIFNSHALQRHVVCHHVNFFWDNSYCWEKFHLVELKIQVQNSSKTTKKFFTFDVSTSTWLLSLKLSLHMESPPKVLTLLHPVFFF